MAALGSYESQVLVAVATRKFSANQVAPAKFVTLYVTVSRGSTKAPLPPLQVTTRVSGADEEETTDDDCAIEDELTNIDEEDKATEEETARVEDDKVNDDNEILDDEASSVDDKISEEDDVVKAIEDKPSADEKACDVDELCDEDERCVVSSGKGMIDTILESSFHNVVSPLLSIV